MKKKKQEEKKKSFNTMTSTVGIFLFCLAAVKGHLCFSPFSHFAVRANGSLWQGLHQWENRWQGMKGCFGQLGHFHKKAATFDTCRVSRVYVCSFVEIENCIYWCCIFLCFYFQRVWLIFAQRLPWITESWSDSCVATWPPQLPLPNQK